MKNFLIPLALLASAACQSASSYDIQDGDTFTVDGVTYRLWGMDTPELGVSCQGDHLGDLATEELTTLLGQGELSCKRKDEDPFGRTVAMCDVQGQDIGEALVRNGWARDWPRYSGRFYAEAETLARKEKAGVWAYECPDIWPDDRDYD